MKCRHCGAPLSLVFLDLGTAPPANSLVTEEGLHRPETWYPLRLLSCQSCWLVQTEDYAGRDELFSKEYVYFSSYSTTWLAHARDFARLAITRFHLSIQSFVVEIGSNDGYLLRFFQEAGIPCLGIEPTASTAGAARALGLEVVERFFGQELAEGLSAEGRRADLVIANNVLAHVPDINDFVAGVAKLLKPNGVVSFEFQHLLSMVEGGQFDTAYHEHYSYLSFLSAQRILQKNGLHVFDVDELPTHGGSLRVFARRADGGVRPESSRVALLREKELEAGVATSRFHLGFQERAERIRDDLLLFLIDAKRRGQRVAGYGAAAKGITCVNFAGLRRDLLPHVVDRNPAKQGKYLPGSRIPIVGEECLFADRPDLIVILAWNLREEVMRQLQDACRWGAKFVTAVPRLELWSGSGS